MKKFVLWMLALCVALLPALSLAENTEETAAPEESEGKNDTVSDADETVSEEDISNPDSEENDNNK